MIEGILAYSVRRDWREYAWIPFFHAYVSLVGCFVATFGKRLAILRRLGCPDSIPYAPPHPRMLRILPPPVPEGEW